MESRSRASPEQFAALLEFMESHGDITRPQQGPQGRIKADRLWTELGELLNSIGGGVKRPTDKWKKVWADWKTKTKKKALALRGEASGTGGGPSSRITITASEERVLAIMGLTAVTGQAGIEERGFDAPPSDGNSVPTVSQQSLSPQRPATDNDIMLDFIPSPIIYYPIQATTASTATPLPPSELPRHPPPPVLTPPPGTASAPMVTSPNPSTSRGAPQRRRHQASPSPVASPTTSTPRRRRLLRARTRRTQTPFERATSEFVAVEHRRLQQEAERDNKYHQREMERLRLESRRIDVEEKQNEILSRLAGTLDSFKEILPQLKLSSLPSTDIIP